MKGISHTTLLCFECVLEYNVSSLLLCCAGPYNQHGAALAGGFQQVQQHCKVRNIAHVVIQHVFACPLLRLS